MASLPPVKKKGRGFERAPSNGTAPSTSTNSVAGDSPVSARARGGGGGGGAKSKKNTAKAAARGVAVSASAAAAVRQKPKAAKQRRNERERRLGEAASRADLARVSFAVTNHFHTNEVVLVPRSRGGFVYGAVQGSRSSTQCPHDAAAVHRRPHRYGALSLLVENARVHSHPWHRGTGSGASCTRTSTARACSRICARSRSASCRTSKPQQQPPPLQHQPAHSLLTLSLVARVPSVCRPPSATCCWLSSRRRTTSSPTRRCWCLARTAASPTAS